MVLSHQPEPEKYSNKEKRAGNKAPRIMEKINSLKSFLFFMVIKESKNKISSKRIRENSSRLTEELIE
jgi:hypothetical protein